jgi:TRAP-type transport system periplasmic protein
VDGYTPGRFVLSQVAEFPFLGDNAEINSVAYQRIYERMLAKANEHAGVKVLAVFTHGPGQLYNARRPITALKDLQGLKIRTGGGLVNDVVKAIGPVAMLKAAPEVYELLSAGVIDGFVFPKETPLSLKLIPLVKYVTYTPGGLYNVSFTFIMNLAKWSSIKESDRMAIEPLFGENLARRSGRGWDRADAKGEAAVREAKINVSQASSAFVGEIRAKTAHLEEAWFKKAATRGVNGELALRALRAEIAVLAK